MKQEPLAITPAEAGDLIGVSRSKAYAMASSGDLPTIRIGRKTMIPLEPLRRWIAERTREAHE